MFSMKWRLVVARTLVVVLAGNPVLMAAHGIERSHRREADFELTERREQLRLQIQAAAAARAAAWIINAYGDRASVETTFVFGSGRSTPARPSCPCTGS